VIPPEHERTSISIDVLKAQLDELAAELHRVPSRDRRIILARIWELSGRIAEANEESSEYTDACSTTHARSA